MDVEVKMMRKKSVILGFAGSGKTHTLALLLNKKLSSQRVSTSCVQTPIRTIGHRRFTKGITSTSYLEISPKEYSKKMMKSGKEVLESIPSGTIETKLIKERASKKLSKWMQSRTSSMSGAIARKKAQKAILAVHIEKDLIDSLLDTKSAKSFINELVGEMCDSGGQPQFREILPRFISGLALAILVVNLSERLDEYPTSYFYGKDGKPVSKGQNSKLTNEQMLRQFLQMVVSQSRENKKIKFMFVGTHKDLEHKCNEAREIKESKLSAMVKSFDLQDNAIYADHECKKLIFSINAKEPDASDYEVGQKIMKKVMEEEGAEIISIPVKYHVLELAIMSLSKSERIAFTISELLKHLRKYFNEESLREGLKYLEKSNRIFYFSELFPNLVIGEPQAVLNMVTKIVEDHIRMTNVPDKGRVLDGVWKKFKEQGILTETILKQISNDYDSDFTAKHMLKLLEKLLIVFKRNSGEYLMPCLLSTEASLPYFESQIQMLQFPMMLHFPKGIARVGIFCCTICKLVSGEKWKHYEYSNASRNSFCLTRKGSLGIVVLHDFFDSFFRITLHFPADPHLKPNILPSTCVAVRETVKRVINEVTMALSYEADQPVLAFECMHKHTPSLSIHAAEYMQADNYLLCTKNCTVHGMVTNWHRLWQGLLIHAMKACFHVVPIL